MTEVSDAYGILIAKLETRVCLNDADRDAVRQLAVSARTLPAQTYLTREGETPQRCAFILAGFAYRHKITAMGNRAIVSVMIPGDFTDLQQLFLAEADHNVTSLTRMDIAQIDIADLRALAAARPSIAQALWIDALIEGSIMRETVLNVSRRDGPTRLAHLLCEFQVRLGAAGLGDLGYDLPMSQEQMGDTTGLTSVHVNRMLKQLQKEGLISRSNNGRMLHIEDWKGLQERADFNPGYLHLDQARRSIGFLKVSSE